MISLIAAAFSARMKGYTFDWARITKTLLVPGALGVLVYLIGISWLLGIPFILFVSALGYARLQVLSKEDLFDLSLAFMSKDRITRLYARARPLVEFFYGG
jgi:hypothetical protein